MTQDSFTNYKILLEVDYAALIYSIIKKIRIGKCIKYDMLKAKLLWVYIEMVLNYHLFLTTETNYNALTSDEMIEISHFINQLLGTTYNPDFILDN